MRSVIVVTMLFACALMIVTPAQAKTKLELGVIGAASMTTLTGDVTDLKSTIGFGGGGLARVSPSPQFAVQPEVWVVLKGAKDKNDSSNKLKLTYIEVPVLAMYTVPTQGKIHPTIFAGPSVGLLLSAKANGVDVKDSFKKSDFGGVVGAGVDIITGAKGKVHVDGRYTHGFANILKDSGDFKERNSVIAVTVSYLFQLGDTMTQ